MDRLRGNHTSMDENQAFGLEFSLMVEATVARSAIRVAVAKDQGPGCEMLNTSNDLSDSINNQNYMWTSNQMLNSEAHKQTHQKQTRKQSRCRRCEH